MAAAKQAKKNEESAAATAAGFPSVAAWKKAARSASAAALAAQREKTNGRLLALGLDEKYSVILDTLECAVAAGLSVTHAHARATLYAYEHNSPAWQAYCEGELDAAQLLHRVERAQNRHENTDYDELLRSGMEREVARELIR